MCEPRSLGASHHGWVASLRSHGGSVLTASEGRVLDTVSNVTGVKAMAERLGVSQATVRSRLHNLFRKTGDRRQSGLVKLVAVA